MDARGEQLVLDYLRQLADAAQRVLRPDERLAFMARSRAAIARQVGETRAAQASDLHRLLKRFGDPQTLVAEERQRLDRLPATAGPARPPSAAPALDRPALDQPDQPALPDRRQPLQHRPMTARWRPGSDQASRPRSAAPGLRDLSRWAGAPRRPAPSRPGGPGGPGPPRPGRKDWWRPEDGEREPVPDSRESVQEDGWEPGPAAGRPPWSAGLLVLLRSHPLECGAIALIGVGGLIEPFPWWVIGALAVLISRLWDVRDKLATVAVPVAVALIGAIVLAGLTSKSAGLSGYAHAARVDGWDLIRAGGVLGAAYLGWRVRQGRRPRENPPWRRLTHG
jgi:hypothetical protein